MIARTLAVCLAGLALLTACGTGGITDPPTPTPGPETVVLQWFRTGGPAGFCDELTVLSNGQATLGACNDPTLAQAGRRPLPADIWSQLSSWLNTVVDYTDVETDQSNAEPMTIAIIFNGTGIGEPQEMDREALRGFSAGVFATMHRLIRAGCTMETISAVEFYRQPDWEAEILASDEAGTILKPDRQTVDGWLAIEPNPDQAGERLAAGLWWLAPNVQASRDPGCEVLPQVSALSPDTCFLIVLADMPVQIAPTERSATLVTMRPGEYISVIGETESGWLLVVLDESSSLISGTGWMSAPGAELAGVCDDLPQVDS